MSETLHTCPRCAQHGFSSRGLSAHVCRAGGERSRLTPGEIAQAINAAADAAPAQNDLLPSPFPMPDTTATPPALFHADPVSLVEHPALARLPAIDRHDPGTAEFLLLVEQAGEITEPVRVDEQGRLVDGRRRRLAAEILGLPLPALRCRGDDAATLVFNNLAARRNLPKNVVAYFAWPYIQPLLAEARARWIERLKTGKNGGHETKCATSAFGPRMGANAAAESAKTVAEILSAFGIDRHIATETQEAAEAFAALPAEFRARLEARLLDGALTLGAARQAAAGHLSTAGRERPPVDLDSLVAESLAALRQRFKKWERMPAEHRTAMARELGKDAADWPEEAQREVLAALKRSLKA